MKKKIQESTSLDMDAVKNILKNIKMGHYPTDKELMDSLLLHQMIHEYLHEMDLCRSTKILIRREIESLEQYKYNRENR